jgi:peptidoglycan/LPS O-acetylase OafA/YrhL
VPAGITADSAVRHQLSKRDIRLKLKSESKIDTMIKVNPALNNRGRLTELDSLRGVAALSVVLGHCKLLCNESALSGMTKFLDLGPLRLITAGREAVILFFVLSGFVLSIPALRTQPQPYRVFLVRRISRIYLPYLAALALAVWGASALHNFIPGTAWFHSSWSHPINWHLVLQHVLFIGTYDTNQFNDAFWSLVVEMRVSLIFPVLCALALKLKPTQSLVFAIFLSLGSILSLHFVPHLVVLIGDTPHYAGFFVIGIYLARQQKQISKFYASFSRRTKIMIAPFCVFLYIYSGFIYSVVIFKHTGRFPSLESDWLTALGAASIIVFSLNSGLFRGILLSQPIRFLGRVSYSMYLIHLTIIFALMHLLSGHLPLLAIIPLCLATTIFASAIFYRTVEKPSMGWGRRLSNYLLPAKTSSVQMPASPDPMASQSN